LKQRSFRSGVGLLFLKGRALAFGADFFELLLSLFMFFEGRRRRDVRFESFFGAGRFLRDMDGFRRA